MRFSDHATCKQFLKAYDDIPQGDRKVIPLEAVVLVSGVDFTELVGAILLAYRSYQAQKVAFDAMAAHPEVLQHTIDYAALPSGVQDRRTLHAALGFLPTPKGATMNFNFGGTNGDDKKDSVDELAPDVNEVFPLINSKQEDWQNKRQKLLQGN